MNKIQIQFHFTFTEPINSRVFVSLLLNHESRAVTIAFKFTLVEVTVRFEYHAGVQTGAQIVNTTTVRTQIILNIISRLTLISLLDKFVARYQNQAVRY